MKFFGTSKANLFTIIVAAFITLLIQQLVFTPHCKLLIVVATFIIVYTLTYLIIRFIGKK